MYLFHASFYEFMHILSRREGWFSNLGVIPTKSSFSLVDPRSSVFALAGLPLIQCYDAWWGFGETE